MYKWNPLLKHRGKEAGRVCPPQIFQWPTPKPRKEILCNGGDQFDPKGEPGIVLGDVVLGDVVLEDVVLGDVVLGDVVLEDVVLGDVVPGKHEEEEDLLREVVL